MATQKSAHIIETKNLNADTKLLTLALKGAEPLGFTGGQYIIVNTNIPLPGDKIAKRAYSILSKDEDQTKFNIAVKKVGQGPGSNYMHATEEGHELLFSGPWGQYVVDESCHDSSVLVVASDTGITAGLGLIQSCKFKKQVKNSHLLWLVESKDYFIPEGYVKDLISSLPIYIEFQTIPAVLHPDRLANALGFFKSAFKAITPEYVFLSGDGALLYPFKDQMLAGGMDERMIKIECFFNNPFKKIGSK